MYRRSDPRWNRTLQHITENIEHANESAQENIYGFTQRYVTPCLASITQCVNACTAPCVPAHSDRRRHRGRSHGRAELSFDFYDDWEEDESDGLLGWGNDNLDRFLGGGADYGTNSQPSRQPTMSYGQRSRDPRYDSSRRKSTTLLRDSGQDPTIIPSSSYFGFLGRLPFNIGGRGLRYKPSAADLTEHPGAVRQSAGEEQPLVEDSDEDADHFGERKAHRRQRSDTHTSGYTTDSLSSRGDIFPSEDELEDAVPLDDEFTISLERRTTAQWADDNASTSGIRSARGKRPSGSRLSVRTASSRNTQETIPKNGEGDNVHSQTMLSVAKGPILEELQREEDTLRREEEAEVQRRRHEAHQLAVKRGLVSKHSTLDSSRSSSPSGGQSQMAAVFPVISPLVRSSPHMHDGSVQALSAPPLNTLQSTSSVHTWSISEPAATERPLPDPRPCPDGIISTLSNQAEFVPARLPYFGP